MVSTAALIAALQGQFAGARQGAPPGGGSGIPRLVGGKEESPGNALLGGAAGGVPFTATTGTSVANALQGGGDPLAQQLQQSDPTGDLLGLLTNRGPSDPSGASLGEFDNLQGGDLNILKSMVTLNPLLMFGLIGSAVSEQGESPGLGTGGIPFAERDSGQIPRNTGLSPSLNRNLGSLGIANRDRDTFSPPDPGPGPNRGTGGGNRGR